MSIRRALRRRHSSLFPSLDASSPAPAPGRSPSPPADPQVHRKGGGLTASYDVHTWGANRSAANAAGASLEAQPSPPPPLERRQLGGRWLRHAAVAG